MKNCMKICMLRKRRNIMRKRFTVLTAAAWAASLTMAWAVNSYAAEESAPAGEQSSVISEVVDEKDITETAASESNSETVETAVVSEDGGEDTADAVSDEESADEAAAVREENRENEEKSAPMLDEKKAIGEALISAGRQYKYESSEWKAASSEGYWRVGVRDVTNKTAPVRYYRVNSSYAFLEDASFSHTTAPAAAVKQQTQTTAAAEKNDAPKTGIGFPAAPAAGLVLAAAAVAFTLRKKEC